MAAKKNEISRRPIAPRWVEVLSLDTELRANASMKRESVRRSWLALLNDSPTFELET